MTESLRDVLRGLPVFDVALPEFDPAGAPAEPVPLFNDWLLGAVSAGVQEPHAMTVSTAGADGMPSARILILKNVTADGWQFASAEAGHKGRDLAERPYAALTFHWQPLGRQVRIRGPVVRESAERSAADFLARSTAARAEALLGMQSKPLADPAERDGAVAEAVARIEREPGLVAPGWLLHTVCADSVEFWQGDRDRNHTRLHYRRTEQGWVRELLWP
ncbi:pyridoxal 5'-phosphate synthase [Streptomyces sp. NPDC093109]|uniref:pyridoxine/pyridoxamine 5'-phosphate oxidase n=1 Tax=Streptomyces sp. NPDC093109 TaxID=3154977 RepID=UPI0034506308